MTPLNVCILTETYYPVVGGGETQAQRLADGLSALGSGVLVLTRRSDPALARLEHYGAVRVHRLPPAGAGHLKKWGLLLTSFPMLLRLRRQYDLVFVSGFRVVGLPAVLASKLLRKTCVLKADSLGEMSGAFFTDGLARLRLHPSALPVRVLLALRNMFLRQADAFVAISSPVCAELAAGGVQPERIHRLPNSVDTGRFCPLPEAAKGEMRRKLGLPVAGKIAIFVGRLVTYKGLPLLVRVWREICQKHSGATLVLVGAGGLDMHNCEAELRAYVESNGLDGSVHFAGEVRNVHEYLQASDVFVFPSEREAFGIALIEAMACGLPVISTPVGGVKDIFQHGQDGLVVQPGDFQQLDDALDLLITNRAPLASLGQAARRTVQERYSVETVTQKHVALFKHLSPRAAEGSPPNP